ncbi:cellular tumor antigen p53-like isoform X2 [Ochlerotatus camptorhynchus]|uniref:cellular tumor antigen p53-like isoform X2 n=1 Tax=Ochlerotatus camptorhynchus TaxID=644619 RepID=UPI0031E12741
MVDSQDLNQTYDQNQQPVDDCDATFLSQIPTNDLMDLDSDMMLQLESYQEVLRLDSAPLMEDSCDQKIEQKPLLELPSPALLDHLNKTPTLDEHHDPVFNFNVDLNGETSGKSSWMFSSRLNKVFVKMGQACTFNISYQALTYQELYVRAMLVCSTPEDMHQPVFRCENHRCSDSSNMKLSDGVKTHVMRCFNPSARYVGTEQGVAFKDRLAVIIPLGTTIKEQAALNVSLEFVCQNSCRIINRRATAIIFTLEDVQGQIYGKKSLHLKVCSCPKRDKQKEEESLGPAKRKSDTQLLAPPGKKVAKVASVQRHPSQQQQRHTPSPTSGKLAFIKKELSLDSVGKPVQKARSITPSNSQDVVEGTGIPVTLPMPTVELADKVAEYAFQVVAAELIRSSDNIEQKKLAAFLTSIRRVQSRASRKKTAL